MNRKLLSPILWGVSAVFLLSSVYIAVMFVFTRSFAAMVWQFLDVWQYMTVLVIGFGVQAGLYKALKMRLADGNHGGMIAANGAASSVGMIACCAHHLTDVAPFLGISAASLFLTKYQKPILTIGIMSNIAGAALLYRSIRKCSVKPA